MANQYTGRSEHELSLITVAEYRFLNNSLRNFMPGNFAGAEVGDLGEGGPPEYLATPDIWPRQGRALGFPSIDIEDENGYFPFPANLDDTIADEEPFSVELLTVPAWRGDPALTTEVLAVMGDSNAANATGFGWRPDGRIAVAFGVATQTSETAVWTFMDAPLHFLLTRAAGDDPVFSVMCNGSLVPFGNYQAGANGIADATGMIFNWTDPAGNIHACYGHHFYLRVYNDVLTKPEQLWRYKQAQKMLANEKFPIPVWEDEA